MEWKTSLVPVPYEEAVSFMEARAQAIREQDADEVVWLLEHPALFTAGTGASDADLIDTLGFPVYRTGRGGQYTYHGPGQRVAYVMLDLKKRGEDLRLYVKNLESWLIATLKTFGVESFTREGRVGVWVNENAAHLLSRVRGGVMHDDPAGVNVQSTKWEAFPLMNGSGSDHNYKESKIAALGVRIRRWVSYHGVALNVNPDLSHYRGIVPCGIKEYGVTSLAALGVKATMADIDQALREQFKTVF